MPVARFNRLSAALAATAPAPLQAEPCPSLVTTERMVERARCQGRGRDRDAAEAGGGSRVAEGAGFVRPGRTEPEVAADIDALLEAAGFERPAFETIVASGPNSALPHARPGPGRCRRARGGAGLRGRLRRILRGSDADG